jgi:hypothetical protein
MLGWMKGNSQNCASWVVSKAYAEHYYTTSIMMRLVSMLIGSCNAEDRHSRSGHIFKADPAQTSLVSWSEDAWK